MVLRIFVEARQMTSPEPINLLIPWNGCLSLGGGAKRFMRNCPRPRHEPTIAAPETRPSLPQTLLPGRKISQIFPASRCSRP